ncbi:UNVERIFIED_CONTAM: hypothetical protein FKN15_067058 [Acipenser sinensis]
MVQQTVLNQTTRFLRLSNISVSDTVIDHHVKDLGGQLWFNKFLVWDPNEFDGLDHMTVPMEFIWTPDFYIYEFVGEDLSPFTPYLSLHHDGKVIHDKPLRAVTSCNLDIFYFPFDTHSCILTFGVYLHTGDYIYVSTYI